MRYLHEAFSAALCRFGRFVFLAKAENLLDKKIVACLISKRLHFQGFHQRFFELRDLDKGEPVPLLLISD
jgi:hypothetical protein